MPSLCFQPNRPLLSRPQCLSVYWTSPPSTSWKSKTMSVSLLDIPIIHQPETRNHLNASLSSTPPRSRRHQASPPCQCLGYPLAWPPSWSLPSIVPSLIHLSLRVTYLHLPLLKTLSRSRELKVTVPPNHTQRLSPQPQLLHFCYTSGVLPARFLMNATAIFTKHCPKEPGAYERLAHPTQTLHLRVRKHLSATDADS